MDEKRSTTDDIEQREKILHGRDFLAHRGHIGSIFTPKGALDISNQHGLWYSEDSYMPGAFFGLRPIQNAFSPDTNPRAKIIKEQGAERRYVDSGGIFDLPFEFALNYWHNKRFQPN